MYTEFIAIYVGLGVIVALQVFVVVLLLVLLRRTGKMHKKGSRMIAALDKQEEGLAIAFCPNCATGFNSTEKICPNCGRIRE